MSGESPERFILIVVGSTLRAEEVDRPLAYYLKQQVERAIARRPVPEDNTPTQVAVVADFRWLNDEPLQSLPTLSVGGPGVNALAHRWFDEMPFSLAVDDTYFVQMDPLLTEPRASIWGMDNATTQIAVAIFVERFLSRFLDRAAESLPLSLEEDDEADD